MGAGGKNGRRGPLTPDERAERYSTEGQRLLAGGPSDENSPTEEPENYRLSEQELAEVLQREQIRNADPAWDGTLIPPPRELLEALRRQAGRSG